VKHLFSLVTALAATAALLFALLGTARAASVAATTATPNPSGYATCTGTNPDSSTATWTVGGQIYYTSDYNNPPAHLEDGNGHVIGYHNIHHGSGNPYDGMGGSTCEYKVTTSSNVQSGCAQISGNMNLYYTPYSSGSSPEYVGSYTISAPAASTIYITGTSITFTDLLDVNNVQYKVTSAQGGSTLGTVATPFL
jgi:hypothetical protein